MLHRVRCDFLSGVCGHRRALPVPLASARLCFAPPVPCCRSQRSFSTARLHALPVPDEARIHASYHALRISVGSDLPAIKSAYFALAKQLHPDTRAEHAPDTHDDFHRITDAYEYLTGLHADTLQRVLERAQIRAREGGALDLSDSGSSSSGGSGSVPNAAHNTAANRAYLRNEGVGHGLNPMQRDQQYRAHRLSRGVGRAMDYVSDRMTAQATEQFQSSQADGGTAQEVAAYDSLLSVTRAAGTSHISSSIMIEEQMKDAVSRWDPRELKDFGKPLTHLEHDSGSTLDPLEAKLNAILLRNGVLPDWMMMEKQMASDYQASEAELHYVWNSFITHNLWEEGRAILSTLAAHGVQPSSRRRGQRPGAASSSSVSAAAGGEVDLPSTLPPLSERAVSLRLSYTDPFGPAWSLAVREFHASLAQINATVDSFNVAVPSMSRQRCHYSSAGVVEGIESTAPNRSVIDAGQARVRERLAAFRSGRRGGSKKRSSALGTSSHFAATAINGDSDAAADAAAVAAAQSAASSGATGVLDTSGLSDAEMEQLYRSLSSQERDELEAAAARRLRLQQHTAVPPTVVAALLASALLVLLTPVMLARRRRVAYDEDE